MSLWITAIAVGAIAACIEWVYRIATQHGIVEARSSRFRPHAGAKNSAYIGAVLWEPARSLKVCCQPVDDRTAAP